jgi:hypothetical protein
MSPSEEIEILKLILSALEAWGPRRKFDLAIDLADQACQAAAKFGDHETARRVMEAAAFIQGLSALSATPGPILRVSDERTAQPSLPSRHRAPRAGSTAQPSRRRSKS